MMPNNIEYSQSEVFKGLKALKSLNKKYLNNNVMTLMNADDGKVFHVDFLAFACVNRSLSNCFGFENAMKTDNYLLAGTIIRLQLDSMLRFFALSLVPKCHDLANKIVNGEALNKIKDKNNQKMHDAYLKEQLIKQYPDYKWIDKVYESTSGFVHLSKAHVYSCIDPKDINNNVIGIEISGLAKTIPIKNKVEATYCMLHLTKLLYQFIDNWIATKENANDKISEVGNLK